MSEHFTMPDVPAKDMRTSDTGDFWRMVATVLWLAGLAIVAYGIFEPFQFDMRNASAIQLQQVYTMASHALLAGIGVLVAAGALVVIMTGRKG